MSFSYFILLYFIVFYFPGFVTWLAGSQFLEGIEPRATAVKVLSLIPGLPGKSQSLFYRWENWGLEESCNSPKLVSASEAVWNMLPPKGACMLLFAALHVVKHSAQGFWCSSQELPSTLSTLLSPSVLAVNGPLPVTLGLEAGTWWMRFLHSQFSQAFLPSQNPFFLLESHNLAQIPLDPMLGFLANIYASYVLHTHTHTHTQWNTTEP